jgi:Zn-dependent protease/CBS domain-containing protein
MFDQSVTAFRLWKIPVKLHITLLLFIPYVAFIATRQFAVFVERLGMPVEDLHIPSFAWGLILAVALFVSILLHELAHSLVARRQGTEVQSITLMALGGMSQLRGAVLPENEAWMSVVGPLASLGLAVLSYGAFALLPLPPEAGAALLVIAWMNLALGIFNLLPAFPMDGGRVLRGLLVKRVGRSKATRIATNVGKVMAAGFAIYGLITFNVILILIAGFVYLGASAEASRLAARDVLHDVAVTDLMTSRLGEARPEEPAADVARRLLIGNLVGATVHEAGDGPHPRLLGLVLTSDLADRVAREGKDLPVEKAMLTNLPSVHVGDEAATALDAMVEGDGDGRAVLVLNPAEEIVGLVTDAEIQRVMALAALDQDPHRR